MRHIHAAAMAAYAKDALETDKPWERWEFCHMRGEYQSLHGHPEWVEDNEYRRKPQVVLTNGHEVPEPHRTPSHTPRALAAGQATAAQAAQPGDALIEAVDAWFAENTGLGGCSDKDVSELAEIFATHPTQQGLDARDAAFEAVRKAFCNLQRYSFWLDSRGNVRRCADRSGNWVEFEAAHTLFEPQSVDAALAAQAKQVGTP